MTRERTSWLAAGGPCLLLVACFVSAWFRHWALAELVITAGWGFALLGAFAGWGLVVSRVCWPHQRVSIALRTVWGASLLAFVGGILAAASVLGWAVMMGLVVVGVAIQLYTWIKQRYGLAREIAGRLRAARLHPVVACVALFVGCGVVVHYLGGAADYSSNPYDDDVAYHLFTKQLVERGTLLDAFSFRRMSTLGGQSFFHALLYLRTNILHTNAFDRGMCVLLSASLLLSHRVNGRRAPIIARLVAVVFLIALPYNGINTASYYSGLAWFLALYQTLALMPDQPALNVADASRRVAPLALVGAAACTLRQNYQSQVGLVILISYGFVAFRRKSAPKRWLEPLVCLGLLGAFTLPWLVLLYRSNHTFLFPIMKGTLRAGVDVQSSLMTPSKLVRFFMDVWLTPEIPALPIFALVGLLVPDRSSRATLTSQWLAGFASIVLLSVGFSMADAGNIARYDYGFLTACALFTWLTISARVMRPGGLRNVVPAALLAAGLLFTLETNAVPSRAMLDGKVRDTAELLRRTTPPEEESPVAAVYHRMQAAVPAGEKILILLDQPYHLDYGRNPLVNLDMPGMASPAPGIPCFRGPEPVAEYLANLGIRYVAFVESEHSTFLYRRDVWFERLYHPDQFWRVIGPYLIDVMDNLAALATTRVHLHDEAGMIVLDLQAHP